VLNIFIIAEVSVKDSGGITNSINSHTTKDITHFQAMPWQHHFEATKPLYEGHKMFLVAPMKLAKKNRYNSENYDLTASVRLPAEQ
jgi:hypothetical protein